MTRRILVQLVFTLIFTTASLAAAPFAHAEDTTAEAHFEKANQAREAGELQEALDQLEIAYRLQPDVRFVHARILVLEEMGYFQYALDLLRNHRDALIAEERVAGIPALEERLRAAAARADVSENGSDEQTLDPDVSAQDDAASTERPLVGPLLLGAAGAALLGVGIYGLVGSRCELAASEGTCLQGRVTNVPVTAAYLGAGTAAIAGASLWFMLGRSERPVAVSLQLPVLSPGGKAREAREWVRVSFRF